MGRRDPPAVHWHAASLTPVTGRHCSTHTQGGGEGPVPSWKSTLTTRSLQLLVVLDQALSTRGGQYHCIHGQIAPPAVQQHTPGPVPITGCHCHEPLVRPSSHCSVHQLPGPLQLPISLQLALALAPCSGPHHCMCLQLASPTTLVPTVTCKHITTLATTTASLGSGGAAEDPNSLCSHCSLSQSNITPLWTRCHHMSSGTLHH